MTTNDLLARSNPPNTLSPTIHSPNSSLNTSSNCTNVSAHDQTMKISILGSLAIFILIINLLIISVILSKNSKISRMHFFILHLCVADTSTALFTLLPEVIWSTTIPEFQGGNLACKSVKFLQMLGPYLSSYTLCAMAWDRKQVDKFIKIGPSGVCVPASQRCGLVATWRSAWRSPWWFWRSESRSVLVLALEFEVPTPQTCAPKNGSTCKWGPEHWVKRVQTREQEPPSA